MRWASCARVAATLLEIVAASAAHAQLAGHGGPVRALAVSADGDSLLSGSFDTSVIRWSLKTNAAGEVLRYHADAVNAVAFLQDGRMVTAGSDARLAVWTAGRQQPDQVLEGHTAPVVAIAVASDGSSLASASWDHSVRLWSLADGAARVLEGHAQNVNGVAFAPGGMSLVSVGYDRALRIWRLPEGRPETVELPAPLNAVAIAPDGEIVAAGADGKLRMLTRDGELEGQVAAGLAPIVALALSDDGMLIAAAGIDGTVAIVQRKSRSVLRTLVGPGFPFWSVVFLHDAATLVTGGADGKIRRWNVHTGEPVGSNLFGTSADPLAAYAGDHGADVCHTLSDKEPQRAGPTLAGLFGRKIASLSGYRFSEALKTMVVWSPETVAKLFEVGPNAYTPGTKMPEQRIGSAEDRRALTDFLARATSQ
ncbi:hypothetical protein FXB41_04650 [Bradyrhizobium canariense]|uniref:hypothetical protein n=1 Tax=Bradyrhizobium canariense TaxID=255045 RepID=UPI001CA5966E|nr:hypothetical protein [Bradyrhizobium canariense]MBW5434094.1 hypothetical protein [Bradyrhizobium canariense]